MANRYYNALFDYCKREGLALGIERRDGLTYIVIYYEGEALVTWATFDGSVENAAKFALNEASIERLKGVTK